MPHAYEIMRDKFADLNRKAGIPDKEALKAAKTKAAKIFNAKNPNSPVGPNSD